MKTWVKILTLGILLLLFLQLYDIRIDHCDMCSYELNGKEVRSLEFFEYYTNECLSTNYQINMSNIVAHNIHYVQERIGLNSSYDS